MMISENLHADRPEFISLVQQLQWRAQTQADQRGYTFLVDGTREADTLTFGQLDRRSRETAVMLQRVLQPGDRALLMYSPGLEFVTAFFGCLYAGVIAVPAYPPQLARPKRSLPRLRAIATEAGAKAILCTEKLLGQFAVLFQDAEELSKCPLLATDHAGLESIDKWHEPEIASDSTAFLQFTSGSTAAPKGVAVSHGNIVHNLGYIKHGTPSDTDTVLVSWLPTYHDMGLFAGVLYPMYKGCPSYLMSPISFLQKPVRWLQAISHFRGTNSGGPNFAYDLCVQRTTEEQRRQLDLSCWKVAYNGAEPIRQSSLQDFSSAFRNCGFRRDSMYPVYGLAESTVFVSGKPLPEHPQTERAGNFGLKDAPSADPSDGLPLANAPVNCGSPKFGMEVVIADPQRLSQMPSGALGEIWVRGPSVTQGYWNLPDENEKTFNAFLADTEQGPFLRTGDLGFMNNGELFVTGRIKDLIIIRGRKHYPQDIELTIESSHPELRPQCAAAIAVPTPEGEGLGIVAEVNRRVKRGDSALDAGNSSEGAAEFAAIITAIRQAVAEQHEIQAASISILARGMIPKTSSGKLQRHACLDAELAEPPGCLAHWTSQSIQSRSVDANQPRVTYA